MASNKAKAAQIEEAEIVQEVVEVETPKKEEPAPAKVAPAPPVVESIYSVAELAENHKAFNTYREIVIVAMKLAGKNAATFDEAKKIIDNFKNKEVK